MALEDKITRRDFLKTGIAVSAGLLGTSLFSGEIQAESRCQLVDLQTPPPHPVLGRVVYLGDVCDQSCYAILTCYKGEVNQFFLPSARYLELNYQNDNNVTFSVDRGPRFEKCTEPQWTQLCGTVGNHIRALNERITEGEFCYGQKKFKEAVEHYTIAAIIDPYSQIVNPNSTDPKKPKGVVWEMLAKSYDNLNELKNGIKVLETGKKFCADAKNIHNRLMFYYSKRK